MPDNTLLLLIDVQKDFHPGGSLAIPTADTDAERIAQFIRTQSPSRIVATMDSHHKLHIAHPGFWLDDSESKAHPAPFTIITSDDIRQGKWTPRSDLHISVDQIDASILAPLAIPTCVDDPTKIDLKAYSILYTSALEQAGKFQLCIWPEHCLMGSPGHNLVDVVRDAILEWTEQTGRTVEFVFKGQHLLTEMYSALAADVPVTPETAFSTTLQQSLVTNTQRVFVAGQAQSHCVNYTVRDMVQHWPKERLSDICILTDCTSAVPGFEEAATTFFQEMKDLGVQLQPSTNV